jgi:predicted transcriptional regulator of viral defense system
VELIRMTIQFGNQGTVRRIGALLERMGVQEHLLRRLDRETHPSSSFVPWIPNREKRGKTNKRWGVVINDG